MKRCFNGKNFVDLFITHLHDDKSAVTVITETDGVVNAESECLVTNLLGLMFPVNYYKLNYKCL